MKKFKDLIKQKFGDQCSICQIKSWLNQPLVLELDHIDGNNQNNNIKNLRLLCPNCHSQTHTFRGRNINKGSPKVNDELLLKHLSSTKNIRQALIKSGLTPKGKNYKRASKLLNISYKKDVDITNSQYNTIWINNGTLNKKIKKNLLDEFIQEGWIIGRLINTKPPSNKNKIWITNGIISKLVDSKQIPPNWWKGRVQ